MNTDKHHTFLHGEVRPATQQLLASWFVLTVSISDFAFAAMSLRHLARRTRMVKTP